MLTHVMQTLLAVTCMGYGILTLEAEELKNGQSSCLLENFQKTEARYCHPYQTRSQTLIGPIGPPGLPGPTGATGSVGPFSTVYGNFYSLINQTFVTFQPFTPEPQTDIPESSVFFENSLVNVGIIQSGTNLILPEPGIYWVKWVLTGVGLGGELGGLSFGLFFLEGDTVTAIPGSNFVELYPPIGAKEIVGQAMVQTTVPNQLMVLKATTGPVGLPGAMTIGGTGLSADGTTLIDFENTSAAINVIKL